MAHVHVVIVGFQVGRVTSKKQIYDYDQKGVPLGAVEVRSISPYMIEGPMRAITNRSRAISSALTIKFGNQPIDGGHLILTAEEAGSLIAKYPVSRGIVRKYLGSREFLNNEERWCLWLSGSDPTLFREIKEIRERLDLVRQFRLNSKREATRALAKTPMEFAFVSHEDRPYLLIPSVSSERREYIPIGFMPASVIASNLALIVPGATLYHFGVLHSEMHMAWVRQVCGRLESRYRYSARLVYNNFPWPAEVTDKQREAVEAAARAVLDARAQFPEASLADLYDPLAMPKPLRRAHTALDRAVDRCYRRQAFPDERRRFEYLFGLWEALERPLARPAKKKRRGRPG